jgi:DNA-binding GntR family transcriptional regulator
VGETDPVEAQELFCTREALETYIVPDVIKNLNDQKLDSIERAMNEHIEASKSSLHGRVLLIMDTNFHLNMIKCAGNKVIFDLSKKIFEQIYLKYRPENLISKEVRRALEEHKMLIAALKERDVSKTRRLIRRHIKNGAQHIIQSVMAEKRLAY